SRYALLPEAGPEDAYLAGSLAAHAARFGKPPDLLAGDRGVSSPANARLAKAMGVKRVALPRVGQPPPERLAAERGRAFRRACRSRGDKEGGTPAPRGHGGPPRCRDKAGGGRARWVGWAAPPHTPPKAAEPPPARPPRPTATAA